MNQYVVVKGDTLWKISRANNISLDALLAANPQITDPNYIMPGQVLNIPAVANGPGVMPGNNAAGNIPSPPDLSGMIPGLPDLPGMIPGLPENNLPGSCPPGDPFCNFNLPLGYSGTKTWGRAGNNAMNRGIVGSARGMTNRMPDNNLDNSEASLPDIDRNTLPACDAGASMRPCVYTTVAAGETLEQISQKFMVPLSRLLYYNPCFGRQSPLISGARVIIPEGETVQQQRLPRQYQRYNRRG
ncbi:MAG: LysM peptidoglycan-binding domain-containing protein [Clostridia bacterium]|nr:LysM peptidoglycan-binding domain-containing protein [Clostridia bacterium]